MIGTKKNKNGQEKKNNKNVEGAFKKSKKNKNNSPGKVKVTPEKKKNRKEENNWSKNTLHEGHKSKEKEHRLTNPSKKHNHHLSHNHTQHTHQPKMLRTSPIVFNTSKSKERSVSIKLNTNRSHHMDKEKQTSKNIARRLFKQNKENLKSKSNQKSNHKSKDKSRSKSRLKTDRDVSPLKQTKATRQFNVADREIRYNKQQAQQLKKTLKKKIVRQKQKRKDELYQYPSEQVQMVHEGQKVKLRKKVPQIKTQFSQRRGSYFDQILLKKLQIPKNQEKISQIYNFNNIKSNLQDSQASSQRLSSRSFSKLEVNNQINPSDSQERISEVEIFKKQQEIKWKQMLEQIMNLKHEPHVAERIDALIEELNRNFISLQGRTSQLSNHSNPSNQCPQNKQKEIIEKRYKNEDSREESSIQPQLQVRFKKKFEIQHDDTYANLHLFKITTNPIGKPSQNHQKGSNSSLLNEQAIKLSNDQQFISKGKNNDIMQIDDLSRDQSQREVQTKKQAQMKAQVDSTAVKALSIIIPCQIQSTNDKIGGRHNEDVPSEEANKGELIEKDSPVIIKMPQDAKQFKRSKYITLEGFYNFIEPASADHMASSPTEQITEILQFDPFKQSDKCLLFELNMNSCGLKQDQGKNQLIEQLEGKRIGSQFGQQISQNGKFYNQVKINDESSQSLLLNTFQGNSSHRNNQIVSQIEHILIIQFCTNILRSRSILHNFLVTYSEMVDNNAINVDLVEQHPPVKLTHVSNEQIMALLRQLISHLEQRYKQSFMRQIQTSFVCKPLDILRFMRTNDQDQLYDKSSVFQSESEPQVPYFDIQKIQEFETEVLKNEFFIPNYFSFNHAIYDCFNDIFQEMRPYGVRGKAMFSLQLSTPYRQFGEVKQEMLIKFGGNLQTKYYDERLCDFGGNGQEGIFELVYFVCQQIIQLIFESETEKMSNIIKNRY